MKVRDEIVQRLTRGQGVVQVARELGCSKGTVSYHAKRLGLGSPIPQRASSVDWRMVQEYHDIGHSLMDCCARFEISISHITTARKYGWFIRRPVAAISDVDRRERHRRYQLERYYQKKAWMVEYLGGKCSVCGSCDRLEIDHIDRTRKKYTLTGIYDRTNVVLEELKKCQLLCRSCHQTKTIHEGGHRDRSQHTMNNGNGRCKCNECREINRDYMRRYRTRKRLANQNILP